MPAAPDSFIRDTAPVYPGASPTPDVTCALLAVLFWGLGQLYPHVFLTEWAYEAGVLGIKTARWLFGGTS